MPDLKTLQERHAPVDIAIVQLLLSVIPQDWNSIKLDVDFEELENGDESFPMSISSSEGKRDIVMPPNELYVKIMEHFDIFKAFGKKWCKLTYNVMWDEDREDWRFTIDFEY